MNQPFLIGDPAAKDHKPTDRTQIAVSQKVSGRIFPKKDALKRFF